MPSTPTTQSATLPAPSSRQGRLLVLPVGTTPERALLDGLVAQQPNAVAALYDRYVGLVQRVLVRTLGNDRDLDDLTQDVLITVVRRCPTLRDPDALRSFIVSVVLRIARNELRKRAIRRLVGLEEASGLGACMPHDAAAAQGIRHLYGALDRLDANSRAAFVLRHVEGCNLAETAAGCGCSLATVKRWLARAEKRFAALARSDHVLRELLDSTKEKP